MWKCQGMPSDWTRGWVISETNSGLLSDCMNVGMPQRRMMSLRRSLEAVEAFLLVVGKASTHPVNVSTRTRRYLCFLSRACE